MKKYNSQPNEDLGIIAQKFGMPSWKYLYQLNKDKIGDNPDLLQSGTELDIPEWDSTSGDEKIEAKGVCQFAYTGGLSYRYPWVPLSVTLVDPDQKVVEPFEEEHELAVYNGDTNQVIYSTMTKGSDTIEFLIPDAKNFTVGIKGVPSIIDGKQHLHADDQTESGKEQSDSGSTGAKNA